MRRMRGGETSLAVVWIIIGMLLCGQVVGQSATIMPLNAVDDLDLSGPIVYAVNFGDNGSPVVGGVRFSQDQELTAVTLGAEGEGPGTVWGPAPGTADAALNQLLVGMAYRLDSSPNVIGITLSGLTAGRAYLLQLIAYEPAGEDRTIDIFVENREILTGINPIEEQGVVGEGGILIKYEFVAGDATLNIREVCGDNACAVSGLILSEVSPSIVACDPLPADGAPDVVADSVLIWTPGESARAHDVYLGTSLEEVSAASRSDSRGLLASESQDGNTYDPPTRLAWGQSYYWRVDEVNAMSVGTICRGDVWSFTVEPLSYPVENVVATSNGTSSVTEGPENTVNGSGLSADGTHSVASADMWLATTDVDPVYIQYAFDRVYKLHEMQVWNYNQEFELVLGFGLKDVTVEYSENGVDWTTLGDIQLAQGAARVDYVANTVVDFAGVAARYVRLTVNSSWGNGGQVGLSEVRFLFIPVQATRPRPAGGETGVPTDTALSWRAGREAAAHEIYLGADAEAVVEGKTPLDAISDCRYVPAGLELGRTYYWRVDEVNEAKTVALWEGNLWEFSTQEFVIVDDFESYNDQDHLIYEAWVDGWGNETGSTVGYAEAPFAEWSIVHGGGQSMPLAYDNSSTPFYSEAEYDLGAADWVANGAERLRLYVRGDAGNDPAPLYVAVADTSGRFASVACGVAQIVQSTTWQEWSIPLAGFSDVDLSRVGALYIGLGDRNSPSAGGTGLIFIDDVEVGRPASSR